jgi:small-conductance mechanosensitive channel/CRP-like cAMP-binding protein
MLDDPTFRSAAWFAGAAVVLTLIAFAFGSARRRGLVPMLVVVMVGLALLAGREWMETWFEGASAAVPLRETALFLIAFGCIRIGILFVFQTLLARQGIPKILDDFVMALGLVVYAFFRLNAIGVNLAGLITTSAVITGALAFSAQETLGNLWGGIALQVEKTCRIGDWVRIDDITGQVVSIRWRYMAIATNANETIVIPNSAVMKNKITVIARRGEETHPWIRYLSFDLEFDHPPARVITQLERAFAEAEIPNVGRDPTPAVGCAGIHENGIEYRIAYLVIDPSKYWRTDSSVRVHLYAALAREGFGFPYPRRVVEMRSDQRPELAARDHAARLAALNTIDLFASLTDTEREALAPVLAPCPYAGGDIVFRAGEKADSLYLLVSGGVRVMGEDKGNRFELACLAAPDYFGEMGLLLGQPRGATVLADGEAMCYRLDKSGFDAVLKARPQLAETLANVLMQRQAANDATFKALDAEARARQAVSRASDFVRRIQQFFAIDPKAVRPVRGDAGAGIGPDNSSGRER